MLRAPVQELSLQHFDPVQQPPPYVTTPRSVEACRVHGIRPQELLHKPLQDFRELPDESDEVVWYRYMRHEEGRKLLLQRARQTREELVHGRLPHVAHSRSEGTPALVAQQAKHVAWTEQREVFELQKMIVHELQRAYKAEAAKQNMQQQDNTFEKIDQKKQEVQRKLHDYRKQLVEEAAEKERQQKRKLARAKNLERKKAVQEQKKQQEDEIKARKDAENKEAARVRAMQEAKQARERIISMQEMLHDEKIKRMMERSNVRQHNSSAQQQARDAMNEARFREAARKRARAAEIMQQQHNDKVQVTTSNMDEYDRRARVRQHQLEKFQEEMRQHAQRLEEEHRKRKQQLDERHEREKTTLLEKMEKKQRDSAMAREKTQAMHDQQAAIRKIRHDEWRQNRQRMERAKAHRMTQVARSVETKQATHSAVQHAKRELEHVTSDIKQAIRKTRAELQEEFLQLRKIDAYTPDAILEVVDRLADEVLIPQIQSTWAVAGRSHGVRALEQANTANTFDGPDMRSHSQFFATDSSSKAPEEERAIDYQSSVSRVDEEGSSSASEPEPEESTISHSLTTIEHQRPTTAPQYNSVMRTGRQYPSSAREVGAGPRTPTRSPLRSFAPPMNKDHIMKTLLVEKERLKRQQLAGSPTSPLAAPSDSHLPPFQLKPPSRLEACIGDKPSTAKSKIRKRRRSKFTMSIYDYHWENTGPEPTARSRQSLGSGRGSTKTEQSGQPPKAASPRPSVLGGDSKPSSDPFNAFAESGADLSPPDKLEELSSSFSMLAHVRRSQSQLLMTILHQEQQAEVDRQEALTKCTNAEERQALELTFAEERMKASQRILSLTQEHETELKQLSQELQAKAQSTEQ